MPDFDAALWRTRLLRFALGASATSVSALGGVLRNKWLAQHLEVSGMGVLAQIFSSQALLGSATGLGLGPPVARAVGAATPGSDDAEPQRTMWTALALLSVSVCVTVSVGLLFAGAIARALLGSESYAPLVRISMAGVAGIALQHTLLGLYAGRSDLKAPLTFAVVGGAAALVATFVLVPRWGLLGGAIGAAILVPVGCIGSLVLHGRANASAFLPRPRPLVTTARARALLTVAGAGLLAALVEQGVLLSLRSHYLRVNGIAANGLFQAALGLSQQVGALFYAYLSSYAFGKISAAVGTAGAAVGARAYTRRQWTPLLLLAALVLALAMTAATPLLRLLYSDRFDAAGPLMAWSLLGEFGRIVFFMWTLAALPLGGARLWFPISLLFPTALAASYALLAAGGAGELSLPKAYAIGAFVSLAAGGAWMSVWGVAPTRRGIALLAGVAVALALLAAAMAR